MVVLDPYTWLHTPSPSNFILHSVPSGSHCVQARSLVSGQLVATKQVNIEQHEGDLESIRLEIQILSECSHPNVVQYLGSYIFDDILWINLEYRLSNACTNMAF